MNGISLTTRAGMADNEPSRGHRLSAHTAAVRQGAEELTVRESMIFLDGREFIGEPPGLRTVQRGRLMLAYLTDVRGERLVVIQVNWIG